MAATQGAGLLHCLWAPLSVAAFWWLLLAGPRRRQESAGSWGPRFGGSAGVSKPLSLLAPAHSSSADKTTVHFINHDGETLTTKGKVGDSLLDVVVENILDIDGFDACEGTKACSTCHLIFEGHILEKLQAITDENDMLDLPIRVPDPVAHARQSIDMDKIS